MESGKLYLVPTPVGNLEDITLRALSILKSVDVIYAEDTRTSSVLLKKYGISTHMESYHKFNEHKKTLSICDKILSGQNAALITDAGSPGISDPGFLITRDCIENGIEVEALPGATAFVPALTVSGLPSDRFCFEGFLPQKKGRQTRIREIAESPVTSIIYESPYRLLKLLEWFTANKPKGEIVVIIEGKEYGKDQEGQRHNGKRCNSDDGSGSAIPGSNIHNSQMF